MLSLSLSRRFSPPHHELRFLVVDIHEHYSTKIPDLVRFASRERERRDERRDEEEKRQPSIGFFSSRSLRRTTRVERDRERDFFFFQKINRAFLFLLWDAN